MVKCFLESKNAKQALEMKNGRADTALHVAVRNGHLEVVNRLVQENPKLLDLVNNHKESPLYLAVERGFFKIADELLKGNSSECSCEGTKGMTALHAAVIRTHKDIMEVLFEMKKDVIKKADEFGWTPLHYAAHLGHLKATEKLLKYDKSVAGLLDVEHSCALHIAAKEGHTNVMEQIITCLPDVYDLIDNKGRTILHVAAQYGNARVVKYILKKPNLESIINEPDKEGNTPLHLAAIYGHYGVVIMLAADDRVDKRAMNNEYLKTIDIVQSNMDIGEKIKVRYCKYWIMRNILLDRNREIMKEKELRSHHLKDISNTHLLVATLIATVTFAAGFTLPGGYNDDDPDKGKAVLSTKIAFKTFLLSDGIAFYCSTAVVFLHFFASLERNYHLLLGFIKFSAILTYVSILGMVIAFTSGIYLVLPSSSGLSTSAFVLGCLFLSFYIFGLSQSEDPTKLKMKNKKKILKNTYLNFN
ncbi:unnamed protein product, partial [Vitis vinifera]